VRGIKRNIQRATVAILTSALLLFGQAASLTFSVPVARAAGTTYYVDDNAADDSGTGSESNPFKTIRHALVMHAVSGDTVLVAPGTYNVANGEAFPTPLVSGVRLLGSGADNTIIWGNDTNAVLSGVININATTVVDGFTIRNGGGFVGAGIFCGNNVDLTISNNIIKNNQITIAGGRGAAISIEAPNSSPTICNNIIEENTSPWGGAGIYMTNNSPVIYGNIIGSNNGGLSAGAISIGGGSPLIYDNIILENQAASGGGISCFGQNSANIFNNLILGNSATGGNGGGFYIHDSNPTIFNNTIFGNTATGSGGGIHAEGESQGLVVFNCILWGNGDDLNGCVAAYSDIEDGDAGEGNISKDPLFVGGGSYDLLVGSPCIDAGTGSYQGHAAPGSDILGTSRAQGTGFDMGAYEFLAPTTLPYTGR
jgi:parallel beta-helix repeat protein